MAGRGRPKKVVEVLSQTPEQIVVAQSTPDRELVDEPTALTYTEENPLTNVLEFKDIAFSITRDPTTQKWLAISIPYDIKTKEAGTVTVVEANSDRTIIMERFQALAGNEFMSS